MENQHVAVMAVLICIGIVTCIGFTLGITLYYRARRKGAYFPNSQLGKEASLEANYDGSPTIQSTGAPSHHEGPSLEAPASAPQPAQSLLSKVARVSTKMLWGLRCNLRVGSNAGGKEVVIASDSMAVREPSTAIVFLIAASTSVSASTVPGRWDDYLQDSTKDLALHGLLGQPIRPLPPITASPSQSPPCLASPDLPDGRSNISLSGGLFSPAVPSRSFKMMTSESKNSTSDVSVEEIEEKQDFPLASIHVTSLEVTPSSADTQAFGQASDKGSTDFVIVLSPSGATKDRAKLKGRIQDTLDEAARIRRRSEVRSPIRHHSPRLSRRSVGLGLSDPRRHTSIETSPSISASFSLVRSWEDDLMEMERQLWTEQTYQPRGDSV